MWYKCNILMSVKHMSMVSLVHLNNMSCSFTGNKKNKHLKCSYKLALCKFSDGTGKQSIIALFICIYWKYLLLMYASSDVFVKLPETIFRQPGIKDKWYDMFYRQAV